MTVGGTVPVAQEPSSQRESWRWLAPLAVAAPLIWVIVAFGLRPDVGLDLTDEGLYLLEADPPSPTAKWTTPYGWHTQPLFRLVGHDVAAFRSWGAWLMLVAAALLGLASVHFGDRLRGSDRTAEQPLSSPHAWLTAATAGIVGVLGGSLYYAGMVRTPSYNWLTVLGAAIATIGALRLLSHQDEVPRDDVRSRATAQVHVWAATIAFGLFLALPAKPTTPALFVLLFAPASIRILGPRRSLRAAVLIAGYALAMLGLALVTRVWPVSFPEVFLRALRTPTPSDTQSLWGALQEFALVPVRAVQTQPLVASLAVIPALSLVEHGAASVRRRNASLGVALSMAARRTRRAAQLLLIIFAVVAIEPQVSVLFGGAGRTRWANAEVTTSLVLLLGSLLMGFPDGSKQVRRREPDGTAEPAGDPGTVRIVAWTLVLLAVSTGFGSGHRPYQQASLAAVLLVAASLVVIGGLRERRRQHHALLSLLVPLVLVSAVIWADNQVHPYRIEPMAEQLVETPVGVDGAVLFLDPARHELLTDLERTAGEAGWQPGDRLFGLAAPWSSTIPWHLGATVPDSIMPTLRANPERLAFNLTWWDLEGWEDAWILTTPEAADPALHATTTLQARDVAMAVGRRFPTDYARVWVSVDPMDPYGDYELWRPNP